MPDLPISLENDLEEFVSSNLLDDWQAKIEEIIPSFILANVYSSRYFEYTTEENYIKLRSYYNCLDSNATTIIENIIWIGASNIYSNFDSNLSMEYFLKAIDIILGSNISLPEVSIVESLNISQDGGWGKRTQMKNFLNMLEI